MKIGIIGLGSIGRRHVANLNALGYQNLMGYDSSLQARMEAWRDFSLSAYDHIDFVWHQKPDCILICTPPASHYDLAVEAFRHGRHTFIEKPLGLSLDGWAELASDFDRAGLVNMVASNWRYAAGPRQVKQWLAEGVLGEILSARLYCGYSIDDRKGYKRSYVAETGAILDVGAHLLDLALDWFGSGHLTSAAVKPANSICLPKMDGTVEMLIQHDSGVVSSIHVNLIQRHHRHTVEITGREGLIGYDFTTEHIYSRLWGKPYEDYRWCDQPDMFTAELDYFFSCARESKPADNPISSAVKTLQILLEAKTWGK